MHVNRFSKYLQNKNLIFATIDRKFIQMREAILAMKDIGGPSFKDNVMQFLRMSHERMELACQLRYNRLLGEEETIEERLAYFNMEIKKPFLTELIQELDQALQLDDPVFLAFDAFNVTSSFTESERLDKIKVLLEFYGTMKSSTFKNETKVAAALISKENVTEDSIKSFLVSFDNAITQAQEKLNAAIRELVRTKQLESHKVESYKEEHPVSLDTVFRDIYTERDHYPELLKLVKFALLIKPSTANVERGFCFVSPCNKAKEFTQSTKYRSADVTDTAGSR